MAEPRYSNTQPVPPPMPICAISARMMSLAVTPGLQRAVHAHFEGLRRALQQALRGQHVLDFAGADAEGQRAERAVRGRVAVAADHGHARLREAQLGPDDVHDALLVAVHAEAAGCRTRLQFVSSCATCFAAIGSTIGSDAVGGGNAVVGGGDGQIGPAHFEAALAQALEGLRRGDFVHQVQVDVEQRGRAGLLRGRRGVPEFFDDGAWGILYCAAGRR